MGKYKVPQPGTGMCCCASANLLDKGSRKAGYLNMVDALGDAGTRWRGESN